LRTSLSFAVAALAAGLALAMGACQPAMTDQPRLDPLEATSFFEDGRSARPRVEGTVARGELFQDTLLYTGKVNGQLSEALPFAVTRPVLERGRERYEIFCQPCHGSLGNGNGIIPQRGFAHPPSFHSPRLRAMAPGYFFDVITNGFGSMTSYKDRVPPPDRWAIVGYIRALQLSQNAGIDDVPEDERRRLEEER
jgi:Cytochrome C oxidase, cbb3-type, subunit III